MLVKLSNLTEEGGQVRDTSTANTSGANFLVLALNFPAGRARQTRDVTRCPPEMKDGETARPPRFEKLERALSHEWRTNNQREDLLGEMLQLSDTCS